MSVMQLIFDAENLVLDYMSFNVRDLAGSDLHDSNSIARKLFDLGFNSGFKRVEEKIRTVYSKPSNELQVSFIEGQKPRFWKGLTIHFSGHNARCFYGLITNGTINFAEIFDLKKTTLARLDIHHFRDKEIIDREELVLFLKKVATKNWNSGKQTEIDYNDPNSYILRIGNRKSINYYRIYEKNFGLQFELEIKKAAVKPFQEFLFSNQFAIFETKLSKYFYQQSQNLLVLDFCYEDWLLKRLRKFRHHKPLSAILVTDYLKKIDFNNNDFDNKLEFFRFLQLLSFLRNQGSAVFTIISRIWIGTESYFSVDFSFNDFLVFIGVDPKSSYQRTRILAFLKKLNIIFSYVCYFSDEEFEATSKILSVRSIYNGKELRIYMILNTELYYYQYPFFFPNSFLYYDNKYDVKIKLQFIESITKVGRKKRFDIQKFMGQFKVSNQKKTEIKKIIINLFNELQKKNIIEKSFEIIYKDGSSKDYKKLTSLVLNKVKYINFYEDIEVFGRVKDTEFE